MTARCSNCERPLGACSCDVEPSQLDNIEKQLVTLAGHLGSVNAEVMGVRAKCAVLEQKLDKIEKHQEDETARREAVDREVMRALVTLLNKGTPNWRDGGGC